jgi:phosphoserine phosphatase RsbU/P
MSSLTMLDGEWPGKVFLLDRDETTIGKRAGSDILLPDQYVSKSHARIVRKPDGLYVENLENTNKTKVGGVELMAPRRLTHGDVITICNYTLIYNAGDGSTSGSTKILETIDLSRTTNRSPRPWETEVRLRVIMEIAAELVGLLDHRAVTEKVLDALFRTFPHAERSFIMTRGNLPGSLTVTASKLRGADAGRVIPSQTVYDLVAGKGQAILFENVPTDTRFDPDGSIRASDVQSIMCAPLWDQGRNAVGVLQVDTRDYRHHFKQHDLDFLVAVAGTLSLAVENARLHAIEVEHRQTEQEARDAWAVQRSFIPAQSPVVPRYEFWHHYEPARFVGGDYFDYLPFRGARSRNQTPASIGWAIAVGDVSGKGMPAALLMARIATEVRLLMHGQRDAASTVGHLNRSLYDNEAAGKFVTFLLTMLDVRRHELTVFNAGHMGPMIRRADGTIEVVGEDQAGPPLGVVAGQIYEPTTTHIEPGDVVVLYTDGVNEAMSPAGELFGMRRLEHSVAAAPHGASLVGQAIRDAVRAHAADRDQFDDITLVCFGRT